MRSLPRPLVVPLLSTLVLCAALLAACGGDDAPSATRSAATTATAPSTTPSATTPTATTPAAGARAAAVYLVRDEKIAPVLRQWEEPTEGVARAALKALLEGPTDAERAAGLTTAIPPETELHDVSIADGVATVDLSSQFDSGGGSASVMARVAQVVATLTRFDTVQRVAFMIDGEPASAIGGEGLIVDPPIGREAIEASTPQILVESPLPGAAAGSPLRVTGTANTFEATFVIEILDGPGGDQLAKQFVTATSGSGTRGTFDVSVPFDAPSGDAVELYAYESSAEDGEPIHAVRIALGAG